MLAYSSIAHAGYLLVAFTALRADGIAAACFYSAAYAAMNVGAFIVITQVAGVEEKLRNLEDFAGLAQQRPVLAGAMAFFMLSMIGIPFTAGFFGKFYVFSAALHAGHLWLVIIGLLNSGIACFYYLRFLVNIYSPAPASKAEGLRGKPVSIATGIALALCVAATLALGIAPGCVLRLAGRAANTSLIVTPSSNAQ